MDFYFECYAELARQRFMVSDRPRTDSFAAAIREVVQEGDRVLDLGTGTGLLAMLAAKAGAGKVYALDQAEVATAAKLTVERNQLSDTVEVVHGNATGFQLAEPVDLLVSEWLGHFAFSENMLDDVIVCRDENLKPGGAMLPSGVELWLAPTESQTLYDEDGPGFWRNEIHGIDFSRLEEEELKQGLASKTMILPEDLMAPGQAILSLDLATATREDPFQSGEVEFLAARAGRIDGFAGWFVAQLSPSVRLDTGPGEPMTHWMQTYLAFPPMEVEEGQRIHVAFDLSRHPVEERSLLLALTVAGKRFDYTIG